MERLEFSLRPVEGNSFVGRESTIKDLVSEITNINSHTGFCISGKRRVGKTSALLEAKVLAEKNEKIVVAYLSLYDLPTLSAKNFVEELMDSIVTAYQKRNLLPFSAKMKDIFKVPFNVAVDLLKSIKMELLMEHFKLIFQYKDERDINSDYIREAFGLSEILAQATKTKCVVILDELPEILKLDGGMQLIKMLRTRYETQKRTSLIISGSIRKTLDAVALSDVSPFYKQLVPKHLLPFTETETIEFLKQYIGKVDLDYAREIHELTGGLPFYLQFIGRSTHYRGTLKAVVDKFIREEGDLFFKEEFEKLTGKEKEIVIALASGTKSLTLIAEKTREPTTTVSRYLPSMVEDDILLKESRGTYSLSDPLFKLWLQKTYD